MIATLGFWLRGWRWTLMIQKEEGQKEVSTKDTYHAVMVGYLVNLLIPRAGEIARCGVLARTNGIPVGHLIGNVIIERSIDLIFLLSTIALAFIFENKMFLALSEELINLNTLLDKLENYLPVMAGGVLIFALLIYFFLKKFRGKGLITKFQQFSRQIVTGIKSIKKLKNPLGFWISSLMIWIIYFFTMYAVSMGIQTTANLSASQVLLVMVMGSIGMVAPVQGGIGTFHALVAYILIQFGITETDGKIFAAIIHGTQVILVMFAGFISWVIMLKTPAWNKPNKY